MKKNAHPLLLLVSLSLMLTFQTPAQAFKTLHSFTATTPAGVSFTNSDGAGPNTGLILSGNTLYGTAYFGGRNGWGTVFAVNTDATAFTTLHSFTAAPGNTNSDGANPSGGLLLSGNKLYGTAYYGGTNATGTVFVFNTNGTAFTTLHSFTAAPQNTNSDGANPSADLVLSGNTLFGTCYRGGTNDTGTVFALNADGTGFRVLHSFPAFSATTGYTNRDGAGLLSGLVLSGKTLYGAASEGGSSGNGTVFALNTDGTGFRVLHSFTAFSARPDYTNSDGGGPLTGLLLSGNNLYGAAFSGGSSGNGTVFALNTNGTVFRTLYSFIATSDGAHPVGKLLLSGNTLYGAASSGGSSGNGTVFSVNVDGTVFTTVYSFTAASPADGTNPDGANPQAGLVLAGNVLYGTTYWGGRSGRGTIFSISLGQPRLSISTSGTKLVLGWPTNTTGFALQSTTNLASPIWTAVSGTPVVVKGQYTVTNQISGKQRFFRLIH